MDYSELFFFCFRIQNLPTGICAYFTTKWDELCTNTSSVVLLSGFGELKTGLLGKWWHHTLPLPTVSWSVKENFSLQCERCNIHHVTSVRQIKQIEFQTGMDPWPSAPQYRKHPVCPQRQASKRNGNIWTCWTRCWNEKYVTFSTSPATNPKQNGTDSSFSFRWR